MNIGNLFNRPNLALGKKPKPDADFGQDLDTGISDQAKLGVAAGWVGLTTAAGAYIGSRPRHGGRLQLDAAPTQPAPGARESDDSR